MYMCFTCEPKDSFNMLCLSYLQVIEFDDGSGSVLRIQPLRTPRDEAIYECVASNSVGEISATTRLTVLRGRFDVHKQFTFIPLYHQHEQVRRPSPRCCCFYLS